MVNIFSIFNIAGKRKVQENIVEMEHIKEVIVESDISNVEFLTHEAKRAYIVLETYEKGPELDIQFINDTLEIFAKLPERKKWITITKPVNSKLTIHLPQDFADVYSIKSTAGNIKLANLELQEIDIRTGAGNIKVNDMYVEKMSVESGAGNIRLSRIKSEELFANSGAGKVAGLECRGRVTCKSGAGTIHFHTADNEELFLHSGAGNIHVYLPEQNMLDATINASAGLGRIRTDLSPGMEQDNSFSATFGTGEKKFRFKAGVGNINIFSADEKNKQ